MLSSVDPPLEPMLAAGRDEIPVGPEWLYEPKWDGFRALVFLEGDRIQILSRNALDLTRYFPELEAVLRASFADPCVVDGEVIVPTAAGLDFEALQMRIHPAASRVKTLSEQTPAAFVAFDLLADAGRDLRDLPLSGRRSRLVELCRPVPRCFVTPQTGDPDKARGWFVRFQGAGLDGVVAKRADQVYVHGEKVMIKVKHYRTVDAVVCGYRRYKDGDVIGSLLLGLHDSDGTLHYVGHTSSFKAAERRELFERLRPLECEASFTGRAPGGPSRWKGSREDPWVALEPALVCEVAFDHLQGRRFRHASRFLRWRPDKPAHECRFDQLEPPSFFDLDQVRRS